MCLYQTLLAARRMYRDSREPLPGAAVEAMAVEKIESHPQCRVDYARVINDTTLQPMEFVDGSSVLALAVKVSGKVRLIDNGYIDEQRNDT